MQNLNSSGLNTDKNNIAIIGAGVIGVTTAIELQDKGYKSLADFQGKVSKARSSDPFAYERAQYIKILLGFD